MNEFSLKEYKECHEAFVNYYSQWNDVSLTQVPIVGSGNKWPAGFVNTDTQARWCAWAGGWSAANDRNRKNVVS